jgi:hypothetical protein
MREATFYTAQKMCRSAIVVCTRTVLEERANHDTALSRQRAEADRKKRKALAKTHLSKFPKNGDNVTPEHRTEEARKELFWKSAQIMTMHYLGKELRLTGRNATHLTLHFLIHSYKYTLQPRGRVIISRPDSLKFLNISE